MEIDDNIKDVETDMDQELRRIKKILDDPHVKKDEEFFKKTYDAFADYVNRFRNELKKYDATNSQP